jgi:hypothetical protein
VWVHPGALKHGVEEHDAVQAAEWPLWIEPLEDGTELVIHAMPCRKQYLDLLP